MRKDPPPLPSSARDFDDHEEFHAALQRQDEQAFEQLVRNHTGKMLSVARRILGNEEDARDAVQQAFAAAFVAINAFEGRSSVATWLRRIVTNEALLILRKRKARTEESIDELLPQFHELGFLNGFVRMVEVSTADLIENESVRGLVKRSIDELPASYRTILILRDIEGYSTEEAAMMLDLQLGAAKVRLHRARAALKKLLEPVFHGEIR